MDKCQCGNAKQKRSKICNECYLKIFELWLNGQTLDQISLIYKITIERVRQIINKCNGEKRVKRFRKCRQCKAVDILLPRFICYECREKNKYNYVKNKCKCGSLKYKKCKRCMKCAARFKSSLTDKQVIEIINEWNKGELLGRQIAEKHNISHYLFNAIVGGHAYKSLTNNMTIIRRKRKRK